MRRKRKRSLPWTPVLLLLAAANIAAGILWSPITSVTRTRVVGADPGDEARIRSILARFERRPALTVSPAEVETEVLEHAAVRSAVFQRSVIGRGLLTVTYRRGVARVRNTPSLVLSLDGVFFSAPSPPGDLPWVEMPPGATDSNLTLFNTWAVTDVAQLAQEASVRWPDRAIGVQVDSRGSVCLNIDSGQVIFGSTDDLEKKLTLVAERLNANPDELNRIEALNLTSPDNPVIVPKRPSQTE